MENKIVSKEEFRRIIRPVLKKDGKTIALCHGVFDLVHPGHVIHLRQAKELADVLVVSITSSQYVRKGPGRPYFDDNTRLNFLSELECVDFCILSEGYTVDDIVEIVEPDYYVKGEEYANEKDDLTGMIKKERELVEAHGGQIRYTTGQTYSSTKLINTALSGLSDEVLQYMTSINKKYSIDDIVYYMDRATKLRILVVGDVIIDKYTYCSVQGLISKEASYSARLIESEEYMGGSLAIARHLSSISERVSVISIVGTEEKYKKLLKEGLSKKIDLKLHYSDKIPTIVKERFLTRNGKREEYRKIFTINNIPLKDKYEEDIKDDFKDDLKSAIEENDVVFICDFGHGLIDEETIKILEENAKYIVLNCQTNSSNMGLNLITKYNRADAFALDQKELKLAFPLLADDEKEALFKLRDMLGGQGWLTRGSQGAYGVSKYDSIVYDCPALTLKVKDTVGAGDSFFALSGIMAAAGAPNELGLLLGNIGGALGANIIGNKESVEKINVLKFASTLLNV